MPKAAIKETNVIEFDGDAIRQREAAVAVESDQEIIDRIKGKFEILDEMTQAVKQGDVRAMIVSGPPGVGKSYGVEEVLAKDGLFDTIAGRKPKYEVVKGTASALGLYCKLYEFSSPKNVLVFDDCDSLFWDELCLNILKGALDTGDRRWISWNTDSRILRSEGIPDRFEFKGSAIFITNIKFQFVRSKKIRAHLEALESRCHYIDLEMDTMRERVLRIEQITNDGMFDRYEFDKPEVARQEIVDFIKQHQNQLREVSLRTAIKLADLRKSFPKSWQTMAKTTVMRRT